MDETTPLLIQHPAEKPRFKTKSMSALVVACAVVYSEAFSMSVFLPFLYFMILDFEIVEEQNVGLFTGILSSSFSVAQFLTGVYWGWTSDRRGRRPILLMGLFANSICMVLFGISQRYYVAVIARTISGLFNGNLGVAKSIVAEITDHQSRPFAFSLIGLCFMLGSVSGPILGGYLADPTLNIPGWFGYDVFRAFKYLLPCVISAAITGIVLLVTASALPETAPSKVLYIDIEELEEDVLEGRSNEPIIDAESVQTNTYLAPSLLFQSSSHSPASSMNDLFQRISKKENSSHAIWDAQSEGIVPEVPVDDEAEVLYTQISKATIHAVIAYGLLTLQNVIFEEYFSIWAVAPPGHGLNLHPNYFGMVLGIIGIVSIVFQLLLYPHLALKHDLHNLYTYSLPFYIPCWLALMFISRLVPMTGQSMLLTSLIVLILTIRRFAVVTSFTSINVLISQSARSGELGFVNGLGQMVFSLMHAIGMQS